MMKTAYVFCKAFDLNLSAGAVNINRDGEQMYIAADSGIETARKLGITPDVIIGDFDSASMDAPELLEGCNNANNAAKIIKYPAAKDDTDSMLGVKYALERGFGNIIIVGGIGGRIDHTLANLALLRYIKNRGGDGIITDGFNTARYIAGGSVRIYKSGAKYVSIIPVSPELRGVTLTGFMYGLENGCVKADEPYTVSNELAGDWGEVIIAEGEALICECSGD